MAAATSDRQGWTRGWGRGHSDFFLTSLSVGASDRCRPVAVCWASLSPHRDPGVHVAIRARAGAEGHPEEGPGLGQAACVLLMGRHTRLPSQC